MFDNVPVEKMISEIIENTTSVKVPPESPEWNFADGIDDDVMLSSISNTLELLDTTGNLVHASAATDLLSMQKEVKVKKELIKKLKSKDFQEVELFFICKAFI